MNLIIAIAMKYICSRTTSHNQLNLIFKLEQEKNDYEQNSDYENGHRQNISWYFRLSINHVFFLFLKI